MRVSIDTRTLKAGDIFIPIKGPNFDGHDYIEQALQKGASQILDVDIAEYACQHRKKHNIPIIAITGSSGKTTTKDMLAAILSTKYKVHKTNENNNNEIGVPLTLLGIEEDTEIAIIEMGMRDLKEIEYLTSIALPTHCVITNIGYSHLEILKTRENIAKAKSEILHTFADSPKSRVAFIPDNLAYRNLVTKAANEGGIEIIESSCEDITQSNLALTKSIAKHFGLTDKEIKKGIESYKPSSNRQEITTKKDITLINDSYNSNPDSVKFALTLLSKYQGRKIAVLGDMLELGEKSTELHQQVANDLLRSGTNLLFTIGELSSHINPEIPTLHFSSQQELINSLRNEIKRGDAILFKASRGIKLEKVYRAIKDYL